jgi:hypothetical protein
MAELFHLQYYIHIGIHKTGSTAIQHFLHHNHDALLNHGILYPKVGLHGTGHHEIAWAAMRGDTASCNGFMREIAQQALHCNASKIVLSSEEFEFIKKPDKLKALFPEGSRIIIYLRRPDTYLESEYNQHVKVYSIRFQGDIFRFYFFYNFIKRLNYVRLINTWKESFGDNAIKIISYDKIRMEDALFSSFMEAIDESILDDYFLPTEEESNIRLPNLGIYYLARMNSYQLTAEQHGAAIQAIQRRFSGCKDRPLLTCEEKNRIFNRFKPVINVLERRYRIRLFDQPNPSEPQDALRYWSDVDEALLDMFLSGVGIRRKKGGHIFKRLFRLLTPN